MTQNLRREEKKAAADFGRTLHLAGHHVDRLGIHRIFDGPRRRRLDKQKCPAFNPKAIWHHRRGDRPFPVVSRIAGLNEVILLRPKLTELADGSQQFTEQWRLRTLTVRLAVGSLHEKAHRRGLTTARLPALLV